MIEHAPAMDTKAATQGARVLIVDNNPAHIDEITAQLAASDHTVIVAQHTQDGLQQAQLNNPDIILLNSNMPDCDAYEFYNLIEKQQHLNSIPLLLIGDSQPENANNADSPSPVMGYIRKPFCKANVLGPINKLLHIRSLQIQLSIQLQESDNEKASLTQHPFRDDKCLNLSSNELYRLLIQQSPDAILVEHQGKIVFANEAAIRLYQAKHDSDLLGLPLISLTASESHMSATIAFRELEHLNQVHTQEEKALLLDKQTRDVYVTRQHLHLAGQDVIQMVVRDISERKQLESYLHYQATHDPVTGLPNRSLFSDRLQQAIKFAARHEHELLVSFIDLDRFKRINDSMGHDTGDQLLLNVAEKITSCLRKSDTVARMGGDEFVLLLPCAGGRDNAVKIMERVLSDVAKPITLNNHNFTVTCSIGYARYPSDASTAEELLKQADIAMYHAKQTGRNTIKQYCSTLLSAARAHEQIEQALSDAIDNHELSLHYQIQAELTHGAITGIEALLRWDHPTLGWIPAAQFIPIAEHTGLIEPITQWIIETVCRQSKKWQQQSCITVPIAVNISATSLRNPHQLEHQISQCLAHFELDPGLLELELTESASMDNPPLIIALMQRLKKLGVRLAIDDFGTGYSNLHYLKQFPINKLKLDGSFVREITTEPRSLAIVESIITMAHRLGLTVVAECVESIEQLEVLRQHGCDEIQGYYFSKPLPADECAKLLDGRPVTLPYPPFR